MSAYRVNPVYERATLTVNVERRRRIAFITPEFVTDHRNAGGLGNYLLRIGKLLVERGHQAEVFVSSDMEPRILMHEGIRVERVSPFAGTLLGKVLTNISRVGGAGYALALATQAWALAAAMQRRHREVPFDIVQSSDYRAVGLAIPRTKGRIHLVRCSTAADLWNEVFGERSTGEKWRERMERATLRRADKAYAPSRFVAAHYLSRYGIAIDVLRPPSGLEVAPSSDPPCGLPERFLLHFGRLGKKTGTPWLSEALKLAFEIEPTLRMVWVGRGNFSEIAALQDTMGQHRRKIQILYPLPKPDLYAVLLRADKAYAPSRFVAAHYLSRYGIAIDVLRPPSGLEVAPSSDPPCGLPERFLLHFGRLGKKTGTPWLSEALKLAFEIEPTLRMVWVGRGNFSEIAALQDTMGQHRRKIQILYPLPKPDLYAVLLRADATIIPSSVDNLPNTAIESLSLGVPVIGTRGASIDELVEDGVTGDLVQPGHVEGLASAIVKFWRGESSVRKGFTWRGGIADEMRPDSAVENLLKLAGVRSEAKMNPITRLAEHRT